VKVRISNKMFARGGARQELRGGSVMPLLEIFSQVTITG